MPEQVDFYILDSAEPDSKLVCVCKIVNKAYQQGLKVYIQSGDSHQIKALNELLWNYNPASFIPHEIFREEKPSVESVVLLGTAPAPSGWEQLLISLTKEVPEDAARFSRIVDLTTNDVQEKQLGRDRFKTYRHLGIEPKVHHLGA